MPLPYSIIRPILLVKSDANMMVIDVNSLTGVRFQRVGFTRQDDPNDLFFELGFFLGELGFVGIVGIGVR
ncbi:hypothetical protein GOBAR_DD21952 [Gossypium barbadense]|nr:hypothetical protein GOBAR_DD21952 [Gossypium barbadense]